ncbi:MULTISPECIES: amidohydrolase family protein [Pseudidiomarina]|uniref:Imidazolonepropionase-like amidohydrolase n=2 Tax=Pseudidiomarina TaxID=2800384 RepID=A0A368UW85_9GAMM|nr:MULTISPECIES: amidohydrolase family protein [Pseudidiomarina]PWW07955.1 imidazolonepropionase-like amidohydrolase [Pseudidiomarina maritima]RBP90222.1 imidazolonepropionase-like amidohydrolase [Pseudidiomarina tainanensis]RCW31664.1 imidazolonepropionase-like amidohydrolase [Pseudidiomarina tainanensis]
MKKILLLLAAVVAVLAIVLNLPTPKIADVANDNSFVIGPVNIFDGEKWRDEKFVVVHEGWITELSMQRPDLDLPYRETQGQVLMPGLIDAHVHVWGDALKQNLNFGVTTVIDMFGDPSFLKQHKAARATTSQAQNADIFGAGYLVTAPNGHGTQYGIRVPTLSDPSAAPEAVAKRLDGGSDFIKIVYTRADAVYQHAPSISYAELEATIKAAHQAQQLAVVHVADHASAMDAVKAGADGLVHSFFDRPASDELVQLMRSNGTFIIPTMALYEGMLRGELNETLLTAENIKLPASAQTSLHQSFGNTQFPPHFYDNLLLTTERLYQAGVPILAGSDAPNPGTAHGWSLLAELEMLQRVGLPLESVMHAATAAPAKAFALPHQGRIAEGMKADLLLVDTSATTNLQALFHPLAIWKNGFAL